MLPAGVKPYSKTFPVLNRLWTVNCYPMDVYFSRQESWGPVAALAGGLMLTALSLGHIALTTGRAVRVERLVIERTRKLRESKERFRRLVNNATDAFFLRDLQGNILDVNKWACDSLGYTREELLSMTVADFDVDLVRRISCVRWRARQINTP